MKKNRIIDNAFHVVIVAAMLFFGFRNAPVSAPFLLSSIVAGALSTFMMVEGRVPFVKAEVWQVNNVGTRFIYSIAITVAIMMLFSHSSQNASGAKHNDWVYLQFGGIVWIVNPVTTFLLKRKSATSQNSNSAQN